MAQATLDRKAQIHREACRLFRERGFHGTSVRDIAERVGMLGGSLYAHMESKEDLLAEIVDAAADRFFEVLEPIVRSDQTSLQELRAAIVAHVKVIAEDLDAAAVYTVEWRHLSPARREAVTRRRDDYERMFRGLVGGAMRDRLISTDDEATAALFILSALNYMFTWYRPDGRMTPEEIGRMMCDYILDGLRRRTA
jgi:AcrR family transcriptional regulator